MNATAENRLLLSFDVEEFDLPEEFGVPVPDEPRTEISREGTQKILDVLKRTGCRATMFITGYFAERCPDLLHRMVQEGHEIASHGMDHTHFQPSDLAASRKLLQDLTGQPVNGFRMARLAPVSKEEILAAGYRYESSLNPVWLPGRYNNLRAPLLPFQEKCGIWQLPVSALPYLRCPLFWLSFKNFPLYIYKMLANFAIGRTHYFNMYSHPWEYNEASADSRWKIPGYIVRRAGQEQADRLESLIHSLQKQGTFITFAEYLHL